MPDPVDIANSFADYVLSMNIAKRIKYIGISKKDCAECESEIPVKRQQAVPGVCLCIACAEVAEAKQRNQVRT